MKFIIFTIISTLCIQVRIIKIYYWVFIYISILYFQYAFGQLISANVEIGNPVSSILNIVNSLTGAGGSVVNGASQTVLQQLQTNVLNSLPANLTASLTKDQLSTALTNPSAFITSLTVILIIIIEFKAFWR